jgi:hypothetical protein
MRRAACVRFRRFFTFPPGHFRPAGDCFFFGLRPPIRLIFDRRNLSKI